MSEPYQQFLDQPANAVSLQRHSFYDDKRERREIPVKLTLPKAASDERVPLIIWSHGLGGSREGAGFLTRYLAGHGYAVLNVQHRGTDTTLWEGKDGHPWDIMRQTEISRETTLHRFNDIPAVLDLLPSWLKDQGLDHLIDPDVIGMSGHSFGATTTQIMAGMAMGHGSKRYTMKDKRLSAFIAYSPAPAYNREDPRTEIYQEMTAPILYLSGTEDHSPLGTFDVSARREPFDHTSAPDQYLMTLVGGDHMVYAGSRGQLKDHPKRAAFEDLICKASLAFWDAYLKEKPEAANWLRNHAAANYFGADALLEYR